MLPQQCADHILKHLLTNINNILKFRAVIETCRDSCIVSPVYKQALITLLQNNEALWRNASNIATRQFKKTGASSLLYLLDLANDLDVNVEGKIEEIEPNKRRKLLEEKKQPEKLPAKEASLTPTVAPATEPKTSNSPTKKENAHVPYAQLANIANAHLAELVKHFRSPIVNPPSVDQRASQDLQEIVPTGERVISDMQATEAKLKRQ